MTERDIELTRRKILGAAGAVGTAGAAAGLGTSALFSDEESFTSNSITAGTLDMTVDASVPSDGINDDWAGAIDFSGYTVDGEDTNGEPAMGVDLGDMKPGDWVILCYDINVASNPACLGLEVSDTADDDNGLTEPEEFEGGDSTGGDGEGELAQNLDVTVYDDLDTGTLDGSLSGARSALSNELLGGVSLQDVWDTFDGGDAIADEVQSYDFYLLLELPSNVGNVIQSDSVEWDFVFDAVQSRNTDEDPYGNACDPVWGDGGRGTTCECPDTTVDTSASQSPEVTVQSVDASSYPEVTTFLNIDTTAGDNGDLTAGDFALAEDGCGQDISVDFTSEDKPVDFVFLIDVTGSMGNELSGVKSEAQDFVDAVEAEGIDSQYALYLYGDDEDTGEPAVFLKQDFTTDGDTFNDAVQDTSLEEDVGFGGDGPEDNYEAILTADNNLAWRTGSQRVIVDITDAPGEEDVESDTTTDNDVIGGLAQSRENAVMVLNDNDYTYTAVSPAVTTDPTDSGYDENQKRNVAGDVDGGSWIELGTDFDPILSRIEEEVSTSYRVRYTTACPEEDGSTRDIVIEIQDPGAGTLYATASYTAPGS